MKNDRLIPGLILVLIGLVVLFDNLGYIDFDWTEMFHLWPLFLIVAGVNLVFANSRTVLSTVIKVVVIVAAFLFVIGRYGDFGPKMGMHNNLAWHERDHDRNSFNWGDDDDRDTDDAGDDNDTSGSKGIVKIESAHNFTLPYTADAKTAELNISGGASSYTLNDTTSQLFRADTKEEWGHYEFWHHNDGGNYVLNFEMSGKKGVHFWHGNHDKSNEAVLKLNPNPIWNVNVSTGAADVNFDLSKFKVRELKLDGGAAAFDVKLGEPLETTSVHVSTGAASVDVRIPKDAACKVSITGFMSSNNLEDAGLKKDNDGDYETPGFETAKNKIVMNVSGGMASFDVHRY